MVSNSFERKSRLAVAVPLTALFLTACSGELVRMGGSDDAVQTTQAEAPLMPPPPYVVQSGDTLSTIAESLGLDYQTLAQVNGIEPPYSIYAGQVLSLTMPDLDAQEIARIEAARRALMGDSDAPTPVASVAQQATQQASEASEAVEGVEIATPAETLDTVEEPAADDRVYVYVEDGDSVWQWPVTGPVVEEFSPTDNKGIDIAGERSAPIFAAADGVVQQVYESVPQYGRLLVIQHGVQYLGFYGHNERILVGVGDSVTKGQQIAEMGDSGTDSVKLHFELRRNARSIDPREVIR